jgi:hypothetical protein
MSYTSGGIVQASDFTGMASTTNNTLVNHYGQGGLSGASVGSVVSAAPWQNMAVTANKLIQHQGLNGRSLNSGPTAGAIVTTSGLSSSINTLNPYRFYAANNNTSVLAYAQNSNQWSNYMVHQFTVSASSLDYFFNAGGQLKLSFFHPFNTPWDGLFSNLASRCGTIVLSATSGAIIAGSTYNGVTKVGGSGSPSTLNSGLGWYNLTGGWQTLFVQYASDIPGGYSAAYAASYISVQAYKSGQNLYFYITYDEAPNGVVMSAWTYTTLSVANPSTTYIGNSWGTVSATPSTSGG